MSFSQPCALGTGIRHTLEKAKDTFGLPGLRLIDPTCGSGHFLLTSFERLFDDWIKREPTTNNRALAQRALDSVYGVDINPYAIAITRFRLLIAAMKASGSNKIKNAPDFHFNLAVGDSLLHGRRHESQGQGIQVDALDDPISHVLEVENRGQLERILGQRYHVVVGNPPYITVKDKALNQAYRDKYPTCHRQYSLGVPFTERFFDLTLSHEKNHPAGYVGMITANSFMKREFGKKLIDNYLPTKELTHIIDTSGAYIPGHGTPTVILFARNERPKTEHVRAVLGIRGEPSTPKDPAEGKVWLSIVRLLNKPGSENDFVTVVDRVRVGYSNHPWSLGGGGITELKEAIESNSKITLGDKVSEIGRTTHTGEDAIYYLPRNSIKTRSLIDNAVPLVVGEQVRDWAIDPGEWALMPYDLNTGDTLSSLPHLIEHYFWSFRMLLRNRKDFGQFIEDRGLKWFEHSMFFPSRYCTPLSISFAEIATHNHFVLDRGGKVFKQSAPVIKPQRDTTEGDFLSLLGLLNSSIACFWIKQVFHNKGDSTDTNGARVTGDPAFDTYQYAGTGLKKLPLAYYGNAHVRDLAKHLDQLAQKHANLNPTLILDRPDIQINQTLEAAEKESKHITQRMIALQEELDWLNYRLYGLTEEDLCYADNPPEVRLGERPFEISLARRMAAGETETTWFKRHNSHPITEIPDHWPADYQALVERRLKEISENRWIKLVERPEYKRRWNRE